MALAPFTLLDGDRVLAVPADVEGEGVRLAAEAGPGRPFRAMLQDWTGRGEPYYRPLPE